VAAPAAIAVTSTTWAALLKFASFYASPAATWVQWSSCKVLDS